MTCEDGERRGNAAMPAAPRAEWDVPGAGSLLRPLLLARTTRRVKTAWRPGQAIPSPQLLGEVRPMHPGIPLPVARLEQDVLLRLAHQHPDALADVLLDRLPLLGVAQDGLDGLGLDFRVGLALLLFEERFQGVGLQQLGPELPE